jgi:HK97 family phage prohead protease
MSIGTDTLFKTERRSFAVELRANAKARRLEGYAATFNSEARFAGFSETIKRGAFRQTLDSNADVLALVDHDTSKLLARTKSGTLRLAEDSRGLAFDLDLPDTSIGRDVLALAERADLGGMSFAFVPLDEVWDGDRRELRSVDLKEISVVSAWPAYERTEVIARSRPPGRTLLAALLRACDHGVAATSLWKC